MIVNKKALYALAAYYEACGNNFNDTSDRLLLFDMFVLCIDDSFNEKEVKRSFVHMEIFFKFKKHHDTYVHSICDQCVAKFLRYIAKHSKFPPIKRLHYV